MDSHLGGQGHGSSSPPAKVYACSVCGKRYQRNTHLRRHEATHAAIGKFRCIYCDKEFGRGDVCRKHMLNCVKKDAEAVVPEFRRGRKPRACEACFNSKVSCDKGSPCGRCLLRQLPCRPRDVADDAARAAALPGCPETSSQTQALPNQQTTTPPQQQTHHPQISSATSGGSGLVWIKGLINPKASSMLEHMADDCSTVTERIPDMSFLSGQGARGDGSSHASQQPPPPPPPGVEQQQPDAMDLYPWSYGTMLDDALLHGLDGAEDINMLSISDDDIMPAFPAPSPVSPTSSEEDVMEDTSLHLVASLQDLHEELCTSDPTYSERFDVDAVRAALCPANLVRFAATFFRLSHVHFPIVHIPSFGRGHHHHRRRRGDDDLPSTTTATSGSAPSSSSSSKSLLLALVIQGAFRSPPLDDVLTTRGLLRLAEEYVFRELQDAIAIGATTTTTTQQQQKHRMPSPATLEALQAALVLVYLLVINNSVSSRRQSRVRRMPEIAYAVRHFDLASMRHMPGEDWQLYIYRETCIRIATWTAVADWHQCGMFRCMPIMSTTELNCDHPCSTIIWDAADDAEFALAMAAAAADDETAARRRHRHHPPSPSPSASSSAITEQSNIREFLAVLMSEKWIRAEQCPRESFNVFDLSTVIIALSAVTLTADIMGMMPFSAPAILRAMARWQELWVDLTRELGTAALMRTGMVRHSNETCLLTRKIVEASLKQSNHPYFRKVGHQTLTELYSFLIDG